MSAIQMPIIVVVDVVAALATESVDGAVWLVDSNKIGGSTGQGTSRLQTAIRKGDELVWTVMSLECEAFAAIHTIDIDSAYCEVKQGFYPGTDIGYWLGTIKKDPGELLVPYNIELILGSRTAHMSLSPSNLPAITGGRTEGPRRPQ
ncbi:MAG TPA: hypothetical protein VEO54_22680 [Thermoanaerobaculia bacterium]|nr:hypothetical protein [Thermoanaerobaculia bacterium]